MIRQFIALLSLITICTVLFFGWKHFYKDDLTHEIVVDLNQQTETKEVKAIEKAKQIAADVDGLSDNDVDARLQPFFIPRGRFDHQPKVRVPSLRTSQSGSRRVDTGETAGVMAQPVVPKPLPRCKVIGALIR